MLHRIHIADSAEGLALYHALKDECGIARDSTEQRPGFDIADKKVEFVYKPELREFLPLDIPAKWKDLEETGMRKALFDGYKAEERNGDYLAAVPWMQKIREEFYFDFTVYCGAASENRFQDPGRSCFFREIPTLSEFLAVIGTLLGSKEEYLSLTDGSESFTDDESEGEGYDARPEARAPVAKPSMFSSLATMFGRSAAAPRPAPPSRGLGHPGSSGQELGPVSDSVTFRK